MTALAICDRSFVGIPGNGHSISVGIRELGVVCFIRVFTLVDWAWKSTAWDAFCSIQGQHSRSLLFNARPSQSSRGRSGSGSPSDVCSDGPRVTSPAFPMLGQGEYITARP